MIPFWLPRLSNSRSSEVITMTKTRLSSSNTRGIQQDFQEEGIRKTRVKRKDGAVIPQGITIDFQGQGSTILSRATGSESKGKKKGWVPFTLRAKDLKEQNKNMLQNPTPPSFSRFSSMTSPTANVSGSAIVTLLEACAEKTKAARFAKGFVKNLWLSDQSVAVVGFTCAHRLHTVTHTKP